MTGRLLPLTCLIAGALLIVPSARAHAQQRTVRFEITAVGDSTLSFSIGREGWIKRGQTGTAVDPSKRDELVARFRVLAVREGTATALVTGQTTAVSTTHVATMELPPRPWYSSKTFWSGLFLGAALGVAGVAVSR